MKKFEFRSSLDDPPGFEQSTDPFDVAYKKARITQGDLSTVTQSTIHNIIRALNDARERNLWFLFPMPKPCLTPRNLIALLSGATAEDFIATVRTLSPDKLPKVQWIVDPQLNDERKQRRACIEWCKQNGLVPGVKATQQQIADHVGLSRQRVQQVMQEKPAYADKTSKPPRKEIAYKINSGTAPATAAARIRATFGPTFAADLAAALLAESP